MKTKSRGNGTGTAFKRGDTYTARIVVGWKIGGDPPHKLPVYKSKGGFKTKKEAHNYCSSLMDENRDRRESAPLLQSYWDSYESGEMETLSKSKQVAYKGAWKKLVRLHSRPVDSISVTELRTVVAEATNSYYTARDCKVVLSHLFTLAAADGFASKDLPSFIPLPSLEERERDVFTVFEQKALWTAYENGDLGAAVPLVMICTGMMPGEMMNLRTENIDLPNQRITGVGMKTKVRKSSPVILPNDIVPVLEDLKNHAQPSGFLFKRNETNWYRDYYAALERAGCRRLEPYCCRHSTATRLAITESIAPQTIQRIMRWSSTKMLDRYAHPNPTDVVAAANTIKKITDKKMDG